MKMPFKCLCCNLLAVCVSQTLEVEAGKMVVVKFSLKLVAVFTTLLRGWQFLQ